MSFAADARKAAVDLMEGYAAAAGTKLQAYRARPASIYAPTAFVDSVDERISYSGPSLFSRTVVVSVIVLHGTFDHGEEVDQRDAFVDGFLAYAATRYHQAGANTILGVTVARDVPAYVPDWLPPERQKVYYATEFLLEGLALD